MLTQNLWVLAHPEYGMMYAMAETKLSVWEAAIQRCYCLFPGDSGYAQVRISLSKRGWRPQRCTITLLAEGDDGE